MCDYIKREDAIRSIKPMVGIWADDGRFYVDYQRVLDIINNELSANVVEVVRCKDCMYMHANKNNRQLTCNRRMLGAVRQDDYCSLGAKMDVEEQENE